jgi:hypothetical protein
MVTWPVPTGHVDVAALSSPLPLQSRAYGPSVLSARERGGENEAEGESKAEVRERARPAAGALGVGEREVWRKTEDLSSVHGGWLAASSGMGWPGRRKREEGRGDDGPRCAPPSGGDGALARPALEAAGL